MSQRMQYPERTLWKECINYAATRNKSWVTTLYKRAQAGAVARRIPFNLSLDDLFFILRRCNGRCELTGTELLDRKIDTNRIGWLKPSVDRIDSKGIYELQNTRIVCVAANMALGEWGEKVFGILAKGYCDKNGIRHVRTGTLRNQLDFELGMLVIQSFPEKARA